MKKRNCFFSYNHRSDLHFLKELRKKLNRNFSDYGFKDDDLGESSKWKISKRIQHRLWSSSITIVLIGQSTGESAWIDWEIWYSLKSFSDPSISRRRFKPKGLLALYLPVSNHNIPPRLKENINSGYAEEIYWEELDKHFAEKVEQSISKRKNTNLIRNQLPLRDNPRKMLSGLGFIGLIKNLFYKN